MGYFFRTTDVSGNSGGTGALRTYPYGTTGAQPLTPTLLGDNGTINFDASTSPEIKVSYENRSVCISALVCITY